MGSSLKKVAVLNYELCELFFYLERNWMNEFTKSYGTEWTSLWVEPEQIHKLSLVNLWLWCKMSHYPGVYYPMMPVLVNSWELSAEGFIKGVECFCICWKANITNTMYWKNNSDPIVVFQVISTLTVVLSWVMSRLMVTPVHWLRHVHNLNLQSITKFIFSELFLWSYTT